MEDNFTVISAELPFALNKIDGRFFKLYDDHDTKIRFTLIETRPNRLMSAGKNVDVIRDRWGVDSHSAIEINTSKTFSGDSDIARAFTLETVNNFVKIYRHHYKNAVHLAPLISEDLIAFHLIENGKGMISIGLGGGITVSNPLEAFQVSSQVEVAFQNGTKLEFWQELMMNSELYIYQTDYRHSILETAIALEYVVSEFIRTIATKKGISQEEANDYIRTFGLSGNVKVTLKLILDDRELPSDKLLSACTVAIKIRNAIVHKGRFKVSKEEAIEAFDSSEELIKLLIEKM